MIQPFNTMSSWGWLNSSLPTTSGYMSPEDFTGLQWWTRGRLVTYDQPNQVEADISQWLIANPHRINLIKIGLMYQNDDITFEDLANISPHTDLYSGTIHSSFYLNGRRVDVTTTVDPFRDCIAVVIEFQLLIYGDLTMFLDYPYATDVNKFEAPTQDTISGWDEKLTASAEFMVDFAFHNTSTQVFDLGPPMYPVSENTNPNNSVNPAFEIAYLRFALDIAMKWKQRQNLTVRESWINVTNNLHQPPSTDDTYVTSEGLEDMWTNSSYTADHPSMAMI
ncbi:putative six-hairpin glycosidase-like protein [Phaeomoniella chlamydospora]|uniref:Putative six-hairpin glycosidase-like protein n=1 Tax=Phaeomoniella chlamydospora TaxID=158046 RepID=A0A0G2EFB4_PHACM|nr:putative six-hairpin glycosidase-like protein [Phaeomoniella chlamydospora]